MEDLGRARAVLRRDRLPHGQRLQHVLDEGFHYFVNNQRHGRLVRFHERVVRAGYAPQAVRGEPRVQRINVEEDVLSYSGGAGDQAGVYIAPYTIDQYNNYFEVEILDVGEMGQIGIGLVPDKYSLSVHPGVEANSVGYLAENGRFYINHGRGNFDISQYGPACGMGDRMGAGVVPLDHPAGGDVPQCKVFFTRNGQEVKSVEMAMLPSQLYPAVGMQSEEEEVLMRLEATWNSDGVTQMMVDCGEEDWCRLDDIRLNGNILEYTGKGRTIHDVGLAQAKYPLDTTNHYFEFEIMDPGKKCYVAIGLTKHNYPVHRHPGWNGGSIAYHADDGKLFHGSGAGVRFGPTCTMGDTMGCGIYFPPDYDSEVDALSNDEEEEEGRAAEDPEDGDEDEFGQVGHGWSDSDDEVDAFYKPPKRHQHKGKGTRVTVFFTRNGKLVGYREVAIPKGGFYPSVGMLSANEKVRVDLRPLTG